MYKVFTRGVFSLKKRIKLSPPIKWQSSDYNTDQNKDIVMVIFIYCDRLVTEIKVERFKE